MPDGFWGSDDNKRTIMYWVDQFVDLRRFESLTLHRVTQKIQVCLIPYSNAPLAKRTIDHRRSLAPATRPM
jgi:telomerase reverse transcriptase